MDKMGLTKKNLVLVVVWELRAGVGKEQNRTTKKIR
jgi:hypothetical protein